MDIDLIETTAMKSVEIIVYFDVFARKMKRKNELQHSIHESFGSITSHKRDMGIGWWDKLKNGFKKIGSGLKKAYNKVIKPVFNAIKPILKPAVTAIATKYGGANGGAIAEGALEGIDAAMNGKFGEAAAWGKQAARQAKMPGWLKKAIGD
jgi:hypothetical protein